ncbi:MAG TPA: FAD-linked oxidase C-terminal domain-containing protein [Solirubrobacteraceae bacterium]|nr:FAD-linked oxidase C-terminal domain-containing protein [Solirubrobacteraceae bacterium]
MAITASQLDQRHVTSGPGDVDISGLKRALERAVSGEVRFDAGTRAMYANDFSIYRAVPIGVVIPRGPEDVIAGVATCREYGAPVLPRGTGTAPSGQTTNVAVVFDYSKYYNQIVELDPDSKRAIVQPGVICDQLRNAAEEHHLTYGPDPATHEYCTFGGMLGNNSCGTHSLMAGKTSDNVIELDVVLYDGTRLTVGATSDEELERIIAAAGRKGQIYEQLRDLRDRVADRVRSEYPDIPRRVSGYNLDQLLPENGFHVARALVGSEGTCANVLHATVRLVPSPQHRRTVLLGYPDVFQAADHVPVILERCRPIGLEGFDDQLIKNMVAKSRLAAERQLLPDGRAWLYIEFGQDDPDSAMAEAQQALEDLADGPQIDARVITDKLDQVSVWKVRESAVGDSRAPGYMDAEGNWEDAAVHPDKLGAYLRDFQKILDDHGYRCVYYGHFGQGCVHTRMDFDLKTAQGVKTFRSFMEKCADLVVSYGGSLAGEYGEGHGRAELLPKMFGPELMQAFNDFKRIWDPDGKMNPNRLIGDVKLDEGLRLGPDYRPPELNTHFAYPDDGGSFATAIERCFGMAKCRNLGSLTMCPSFHATREEQHSTRGRSRLLFEMLKGDVVTEGWRDDAVKESLDLCLACKGCTGDCPVQVDIPTYKAEFLAHYYGRRRRPLNHYVLGLLPWWGPVAARTPRLANAISHAPGLSGAGKRMLGIAEEREAPRFARRTFRDWFASRPAAGAAASPGSQRVVLWPDTFTDLFEPDAGKAAVQVLEAAGFAVELPRGRVCCGRPLYDFGMLGLARRTLQNTLEALSEPITSGVPVLVLEPSCASVFRDELRKLMPHDEHARRLVTQTVVLEELLERYAPDWEPPRVDRRALIHGHCHQKAVIGAGPELLRRAGVEAEMTKAGCCGLAGSFGYHAGQQYEVSMRVGEQFLLPQVRSAGSDTLLVADGFSCRSQIAAGTGRRAIHTAEVLAQGLQAIA